MTSQHLTLSVSVLRRLVQQTSPGHITHSLSKSLLAYRFAEVCQAVGFDSGVQQTDRACRSAMRLAAFWCHILAWLSAEHKPDHRTRC
jgi:hypothetical protein